MMNSAFAANAHSKKRLSLVPDHAELSQRITDRKALDNLSDEFRVVAQDVRVLFEDGLTHTSMRPARASS
jgi:hypothetical protein